MKCSGCQYDSKKRERSDNRCPKCQTPFVFDPNSRDMVSDYMFVRALERVSSSGRVRFSPQHAYYEMRRRLRERARRTGIWLGVPVGILSVLQVILALRGGPVPMMVFFCVPLFGFAIALWSSLRGRERALARGDFDAYLQRWISARGDPAGLIRAPRARAEPASVPAELLDYSFDRAVICDRSDTVDVLLANRFHFENNCAVLGADGYPRHAFETVRTMLRKNPKLLVLALHDADANGCKLAYRLRNDRSWFAGGARVLDVGLRPRHARAFAAFCDPSTELVTNGPAITDDEASWLSQHRLELAVIPPEQLIKRLYRAMTRSEDAESGTDDGGSTGGGDGTVVHHVGGNHDADVSDDLTSDAGTSDGGADSFG